MSIGDTLAEARRQAGLTITQVSDQTRIRESIIRSIEQGDFSTCGGDFYARGHIRSIAQVVGVDPVPLMEEAVRLLAERPRAELLWASPREILNIFQADAVGCHIITVTHDVLAKLGLIGKDLDLYSLETVEMFHRDAKGAGYSIDPGRRNRGRSTPELVPHRATA